MSTLSPNKPNKKIKQQEKITSRSKPTTKPEPTPIQQTKCIVVDMDNGKTIVYIKQEDHIAAIKAKCDEALRTGDNQSVRILHMWLEEFVNGDLNGDWDRTDEESSDSDSDCGHCGKKRRRKNHYVSEWNRSTRVHECRRLLNDLVQQKDMEKWYELVEECEAFEGIRVADIQ